MAVNLKIASQVVVSGTPGPAGKSAYQIAVDNGFEGTESEWLKELHPFKGWFNSVSELEEEHSAPSVGEYAYVKGATSSDPVKIYECSTEGTWSDSGRTVDTSAVQTFRSGEAVNDVDITDDSSDIEENSDKIPTAGAVANALGNAEFSTGEKIKNVGIDSEPIAGSKNLVESDGVYKAMKAASYLEYAGSREDTRLLIPLSQRTKGTIIYYVENGKLIIEEYNYDNYTNGYWKSNYHWRSLEDDFKFYNGASVDISLLNINVLSISDNISELSLSSISQYYAQDERFYLAVDIDNIRKTSEVVVGDNECTFSAGNKNVIISLNITTLSTVYINKTFRKEYLDIVKQGMRISSLESNQSGINLRLDAIDTTLAINRPMFVTYNTNRATTRLSVASSERKKGQVLCYIEDGQFVSEIYNSDITTDAQWRNAVNWLSIEDEFRFVGGVSADIHTLNIRITEIAGDINSVKVLSIRQYYAQDTNYYLVVAIDDVVRTFALSVGDNEATFTVSAKTVKISLIINELTDYTIEKYFRPEYLDLIKIKNKVLQHDSTIAQLSQKVTNLTDKSVQFNIDNGFVNINGNLVSDQTYGHSSPIKLYRGQTINTTLQGTRSMCAIASYNNGVYTPLVNHGDAVKKAYTYTATNDCFVVLSGSKSSLQSSGTAIHANYSLVDLHPSTEEQASIPNYWNDSLRLSQNDNLTVVDGEYGVDGAVYSFNTINSNNRFAIDFRINTDVNRQHDNIEIARIGDTSINIFCGSPTPLSESYVNDNSSYVQELSYHSGFSIGNYTHTRAARSTKALVGEPAMMIWLKGSFTAMSLSDLQTREQWLESNQDYILKIENDTLSIERNGIGNDGSTFNDGATSVIFTTSLLSDGAYKTIGALYTELTTLDYLVVRLINSDARKTCADLLQFGTIRMVGCYNQQLDIEGNTTDYYYDSYPIPIRYSIDVSLHTLEVISIGASAYVYIDGYKFMTAASDTITLGSADISLTNLEVWDGSFGNDVAFNEDKSQFSSKRTPSLFTMMGHYTYDNYEGNSGNPSDSTNQTSSRLESVCSILKKYDYNVINLSELGNISDLRGLSVYGNKIAMFVYDDLTFVPLYMNKVTRAHVSRYGYPMNFAVIHSQLKANENAIKAVLPMRLNGWCCATHSLKHDVPIPRKNSVNLYNELMTIIDECDEFYFVNNVLIYNWSGAWCNAYNMLKMCGYVAAIDSAGGVSHPYNNQYNLPRFNLADKSSTLEALENKFVK